MTADQSPVALIAGAAGGIGRAPLHAFEAAGWRVFSTGLQPLDRQRHWVVDTGTCTESDQPAKQQVVVALPQATDWRLLALLTNAAHFLSLPSIHERLTRPGFVAYATSKAALSGIVRAMSVELGGTVRCKAICPAAIATPMLVAGFDGEPQALRALERFHPVGPLSLPAEVVQSALFACLPAARFLSGRCLDLSGGISARPHDPV